MVYYKVLYEKLQVLRTEHMVNTNWHSQRISAATAAVDVHVLKWLALVCKATVRTVMGKVVTLEIAISLFIAAMPVLYNNANSASFYSLYGPNQDLRGLTWCTTTACCKVLFIDGVGVFTLFRWN